MLRRILLSLLCITIAAALTGSGCKKKKEDPPPTTTTTPATGTVVFDNQVGETFTFTVDPAWAAAQIVMNGTSFTWTDVPVGNRGVTITPESPPCCAACMNCTVTVTDGGTATVVATGPACGEFLILCP